jgi:CheY-like chemotaxis protein/phosphoribosyl 1,2-cyclic phosphodiesterase
MDRSLKIHVVDDDREILDTVRQALELVGHTVQTSEDGSAAMAAFLADPPDIAILDLMMPGLDGAELCRRVRQQPELADVRIIVLSAKIYEADRRAALAAGADAYATKPIRIERLRAVIDEVMRDDLTVEFWGVRGTLPAPAPEANRYGGNTSCICLRFPKGRMAVLDAGTGIRGLGQHLMRTKTGRIEAAIFITHPHWDHINALPFFTPLFLQGNQFEVCGPAQPGRGMRDLVSAQMDGTFFPITPREFGADVTYTDLRQGPFDVMGMKGEAIMLMHPGVCLGYRFDHGGRSVAYVTDNELHLPDSQYYSEEYVVRLTRFLKDVDVLIIDATYFDEEYPSKVGWGHSSITQVADLAHRANVKRLCLHHHDPAQDDADIDRKLEVCKDRLARRGSSVEVLAPRERDILVV